MYALTHLTALPAPSSRVFPWVLDVFDVSAYHFYKLIEIAIKAEPSFARGIIKHLNWVSGQLSCTRLDRM